MTRVFTNVALETLDEVQEVASGAALEIFQLQRGPMRAAFAHAELGSSSIHSNAFSLSARGCGPLSDKRWTIAIFPRRSVGNFNRHQLDPTKVLVFRPGAEFDGSTCGNFIDWSLTIDDSVLRHHVRQAFRRDLADFSSTCTLVRPDPCLLARVRNFASQILATDNSFDVNLSPAAIRNLQRQVTDYVARILMCQEAAHGRTHRARISHSQIVNEVESYLAAHSDEPVNIPQLCMLADVSERTLRNAFQAVLGVSPKAYLKALRLRNVRTRLRQSSSEGTTVTDIALISGFCHLGHFAKDYFEFFGETPSQTLRASIND